MATFPRIRVRLLALSCTLPLVATTALAQTSAQPVAATMAASPRPPVAERVPRVDTLHGEVRTDDFFWMKQKKDARVIAYLEAENAYTDAMTAHTAGLRDTLYREMLGRLKQTDLSVPYRDNGYWYYTRTEEGKSYPIICRRKGTMAAPEEIVLDQNALAAGKKFHALGGWDVSPDGQRLLYLQDTTAFREYTLYVKDLPSGRLVDSIPNVWNGTAWADDDRTFFYMTADSAKRGNAVWRHVTGQPRGADANVFREDSVLYNVSVYRSRNGRHVLIPTSSFTTSEWRTIPTAAPNTPPRLVAARRDGVEYDVEPAEGAFLIRTNADGARNFKVVRAPEHDPSPRNWADWIPHRDSAFVENVDAFRGFVVVQERTGGIRRVRIHDPATGAAHTVAMPEEAYGVFASANAEYDTPTYRLSYSSLVTPSTVYDYRVVERRLEVRKRTEVPTYDPSRYEVRRAMAPARDGTPVPVSILMRKGTALDGRSPLLLYAYGSYGATTEPTFRSSVFSLVDRGFVYAIAHIRGGQEMGRGWYDDGKMLKKRNTFFDFEDVADWLVRSRYTSVDRLVANGGSAGGLLMGVVANERPELFRAIVADVPFVDVVNTMLDASLPLTAQEWLQWGNPQVRAEYEYLKTYSPYDNVRAQRYPWLLVTSSLNDSQVGFHEPTKWVAKLRTLKTDGNPLLLRMNMAGGHGGSSGRYDQLREQAFRYAFMLDAVGLAGRAGAPRAAFTP
ncbi:S9 family peptidase [Roseisolibacter agri]|uniref:Oligopeptidase B n=1 Tax=Roseisolibacter agri TaxID=2014610 RepID=A0AA37Q7D5_9BACT|nr:S9 family peptidase [Roseisolibacter agri]GLC27934.1 oligopeptidase B [Roseisolibacter agri]